jgi:hypothetical protein
MTTQNKTQPNKIEPIALINQITDDKKRSQALQLLDLFTKISGYKCILWGKIFGFGKYHYKYDSGREGDFLRVGFAISKAGFTVYIVPGFKPFSESLKNLGKHKLGKSCLYISDLGKINLEVLSKIIERSLEQMASDYPDL